MKLERIAALLAKAERTDNEAEAHAYLTKAQMLATLASIDLASARSHTKSSETLTPVSRTVTIGVKGKRANTHLVNLFVTVAHSNSAQVDVARDSTYVISYGMPGDLDSIETLFSSLAVQMTSHGNTYIKSGVWRGERFDGRVRVAGGYRRRRVEFTSQTARAAFYRAYTVRIGERLQEGRAEAIRESDTHSTQKASISGTLVLADREKEVSSFHRKNSQARGSWSGYSGAATSNSGSAASAGRTAASRARLGAREEIGGSRREL
ncbi:MAG: DUF2786 domain-containing protein [Actinomycetia bacterium]|jgi:hypothetical protein|nr:DUF2786 domain-containing protein [Actinomycetes bacterium]